MAEPTIRGGVRAAVPHDSAAKHVSGEALYVDDLPEPVGLLHAAVGLSARAHAEIARMDLGRVRAAPGVVAVVSAQDVPGDLSNWEDGFRLALANETSHDRPWRGTYHLVAIYDRALSANDVQQNFAAGAQGIRPATLIGVPVAGEMARDLEALYEFDRGRGNVIRDTSGAEPPLDLKIENMAAVDWTSSGLRRSFSTRLGLLRHKKWPGCVDIRIFSRKDAKSAKTQRRARSI